MSILEEVIFIVATLLATISGDITTEELLSSRNYPHVYILPEKEFELAVCGCSCDIIGTYIGTNYIDGDYVHTIVMKGFLNEDNEIRFPNTQYWNSVLFHEMVHFKQRLDGKFNLVGGLNNEDTKKARKEFETEAYVLQNIANQLWGINEIPIDYGVNNSLSTSRTHTSNCLNNEESIPSDQRPYIIDLIEFYDDGMIEIYKEKHH